MNSEGQIIAKVYSAEEAIPIEAATVVVTRRIQGGPVELVGIRTTDSNGQTRPIYVQTPELALSQQPSENVSWSSFDVVADHPAYQRIIVENVQVFPGVVTIQEFAMVPLEEEPDQWGQTEYFDVTPQEL